MRPEAPPYTCKACGAQCDGTMTPWHDIRVCTKCGYEIVATWHEDCRKASEAIAIKLNNHWEGPKVKNWSEAVGDGVCRECKATVT